MTDIHRFPDDRRQAFDAADALILETIRAAHERLGRPVLLGLCGAQGSGKSTTATRLAERLDGAGTPCAVLSLDDFYRTRAERAALARDVHPLLETRGVPGTHDVDLAVRTLEALRAGDVPLALPRFDKTRDDRAPLESWPRVTAPVAVVILEGWCVGARPMPDAALAGPVNALERDEDADGRWRRHVNEALQGAYDALFRRLDARVLLRAPDFAHVHAWRLEQEQRLARYAASALPAMDDAAIGRFIAHYERLTRWILAEMPARALTLRLDAARALTGVERPDREEPR
jgi:D-glycerate 3-kinase